jgi:hypothetical protein
MWANLESSMEAASLSPELQDLIARVAVYPHGLGFLHLASLETTAITLGVSAYVADEARRLLESREGRALLIAEVRKARRSPIGGTSARPNVPPDPPPDVPWTALELIRRARRHPLGLRFLMRAPLESVAITLEAHPFLVQRARRMVRRRRRARKPTNDQEGT